MYVCLGILALTVAFHLGAQYGSASIVDHSTTGIVAEGHSSLSGYCVLLDNGQVWRAELDDSPGWIRLSTYDLPIPAMQVKFWPTPTHFYTVNNELWIYGISGWQNYGPPPDTATRSTTWSDIKARFGE